ncbi:MAG: hypothetical protein QGG40_18845, partial [Myxococcota bacterium]|nr:hypothetical protein [Myxococcota bacterium]
EEDAQAMLDGRMPAAPAEGWAPPALSLRAVALGLEALEPAPGDLVADGAATSGYLVEVLGHLVERTVSVPPGQLGALPHQLDGLWIGAAMPRFPKMLVPHLRNPEGRAIAWLGPRFRAQDLVSLTRRGDRLVERRVTRIQVPVLGGRHGWVPRAPAPASLSLPPVPPVRFERWPAPALAFHLLAHASVPGDIAGLRDRRLDAPWAEALSRAWADDPNPLPVQATALQHREIDTLLAALDRLKGPLAQVLATLLREQSDDFLTAWNDTPDPTGDLADQIREPLDTLRKQLWQASGEAPPPLVVLDVPALGPRGRATLGRTGRVVAVSFDRPPDQVLCQVLHEEVHPVTDPLVLDGRKRDTRAGSAGYQVHLELEQVAIDATEALLSARAPSWLPAFERWRDGLGLSPPRA